MKPSCLTTSEAGDKRLSKVVLLWGGREFCSKRSTRRHYVSKLASPRGYGTRPEKEHSHFGCACTAEVSFWHVRQLCIALQVGLIYQEKCIQCRLWGLFPHNLIRCSVWISYDRVNFWSFRLGFCFESLQDGSALVRRCHIWTSIITTDITWIQFNQITCAQVVIIFLPGSPKMCVTEVTANTIETNV